ncbi:hypothetical protein GURKE_05260 [Brevundimonas phage vB_BpoS-Gurke]|uniref:Uncharacterized protein n=1 Tax=Brevundimonas phage vB_BpoS-Gurke TaxID=2948599 RepID=A0A9E7N492_9CAUD|nr:hypothetical protein GURKE_05260 [Brevundimonas phage vB_BpoS-Gurke]
MREPFPHCEQAEASYACAVVLGLWRDRLASSCMNEVERAALDYALTLLDAEAVSS